MSWSCKAVMVSRRQWGSNQNAELDIKDVDVDSEDTELDIEDVVIIGDGVEKQEECERAKETEEEESERKKEAEEECLKEGQ
ncbi:MAG: hypothetical protein GY816_20665 [Cytophagales bacterium]|nr:hypothetical protein [Cytophagales bacterium]